jgi:mycobactin phenyloxazoline synthetase
MSIDGQRWIKHFAGGRANGAVVLFPHAGGAAAAYRSLAKALSANGSDTYIVQYPQRADRLQDPAADTIGELAQQLFDAAEWKKAVPLHLFGHCMGAVVAFEFARIAESHGVDVRRLWASAGQAPSTVAESPPLPTSHRDVLADMLDLGGTDPRLLDEEDFVALLVRAVQADYRALDRYACAADVRITADIRAVAGERDHRVTREQMRRWASHTSGDYTLTLFDGGHFYLNDHLDAVARMVGADGG